MRAAELSELGGAALDPGLKVADSAGTQSHELGLLARQQILHGVLRRRLGHRNVGPSPTHFIAFERARGLESLVQGLDDTGVVHPARGGPRAFLCHRPRTRRGVRRAVPRSDATAPFHAHRLADFGATEKTSQRLFPSRHALNRKSWLASDWPTFLAFPKRRRLAFGPRGVRNHGGGRAREDADADTRVRVIYRVRPRAPGEVGDGGSTPSVYRWNPRNRSFGSLRTRGTAPRRSRSTRCSP